MTGQGDVAGRLVETAAPVYFGCWQRVGHYFWLPGMKVKAPFFDPPTPWGFDVERLTRIDDLRQGSACLAHKDGWTALAVHDYTVDSRGNSKSVFCFPEHIEDIDKAWAAARRVFPEVMARLDAVRVAR